MEISVFYFFFIKTRSAHMPIVTWEFNKGLLAPGMESGVHNELFDPTAASCLLSVVRIFL